MRRIGRNGQHTAEFGMMIGLVAIVAITLNHVVYRAVMNGVQRVSDDVLGIEVIAADPKSIREGGQTTLRWNVPEAASCTAFGGWTGPRAPSGEEVVTPEGTTTYHLACVRADGSDIAPQSVTVAIDSGFSMESTQAIDIEGEDGDDFTRQTKTTEHVIGHAEDQDLQVSPIPE